jgi:hypothetical protein
MKADEFFYVHTSKKKQLHFDTKKTFSQYFLCYSAYHFGLHDHFMRTYTYCRKTNRSIYVN